jgi:hypothetical protein
LTILVPFYMDSILLDSGKVVRSGDRAQWAAHLMTFNIHIFWILCRARRRDHCLIVIIFRRVVWCLTKQISRNHTHFLYMQMFPNSIADQDNP